MIKQKITPFLWFNNNAEEAVKLYTSIFKNSKVDTIARYGKSSAKASGRPEGSVMTIAFELEGQKFTALNGGPEFQFNSAISFVVSCNTQEEIDYYWNQLTKDGKEIQCGWLTDKFGVSWQIVPAELEEWTKEGNGARSERVMAALMPMKKLDLSTLRKAYEEKQPSA